MRVIATAGHVDHGKSALVRRLTGIEPDRLAEEQARQMTIDLGFAWLTLPDGEMLGIIDVPGHRDFIENMLAGVGGIDAVLLIVAADEGVMPQTREHLAILDLLGVDCGLLVLTKIDLVDDPDWLALVEAEVREAVQGTTLAEAPLVAVSARSGAGLDDLIDSLTRTLADRPPRPDLNAPRLSIDRAFTISGFGTVVTGTLTGGSLRVGDIVEILPTGLEARVRALQCYQRPVEVALPGSRVAVNLAGINRLDARRGQTLARPGALRPTQLIDARFRHLASTGQPLKHNAEVKVFAGAADTTAHVRVLGAEQIAPGAEGWIQLRLREPLVFAQGDRFILRIPSPAMTIGGGVVVDAHPPRRWRRFQPEVLAALETRLIGSPAQRIAQAANGADAIARSDVQRHTGLADDAFAAGLDEAVRTHLVVRLPDDTLLSTASYTALTDRLVAVLRAFHEAAPLRTGMPREELRSRLGVRAQTLSHLLEAARDRVEDGAVVRLREHTVRFSPEQRARIDQLDAALRANPYTPPSYAEAAAMVGEDVLRALIDLGEIVQVQPDVIFSRAAYEAMVGGVLAIIDESGSLATAALRDRFGTSRKYVIGLLEHLDRLGVTRRNGEVRVRGPRRP